MKPLQKNVNLKPPFFWLLVNLKHTVCINDDLDCRAQQGFQLLKMIWAQQKEMNGIVRKASWEILSLTSSSRMHWGSSGTLHNEGFVLNVKWLFKRSSLGCGILTLKGNWLSWYKQNSVDVLLLHQCCCRTDIYAEKTFSCRQAPTNSSTYKFYFMPMIKSVLIKY